MNKSISHFYYNYFSSALLMLIFLPVFTLLPLVLCAQEYNEEADTVQAYVRPEYKVYKSLSYALSEPDSVYILVLKGKKLRKVPDGILKLPHLLVLDMSKNKIDSIPDFISQMTSLEELDFSANKLKALPKAISKLTNLKKLALNRNVITHLPPTISELKSLQILELWDNEIQDLPDEIKDLGHLKTLELRGILFSEEEQMRFHELLPNTQIFMSPPCDCKNY